MTKRSPRRIDKSMQKKIIRDTEPFIEGWVKDSDLPKYSLRWFLAARSEAFKSDFHTFKVGCVIVYKNHIIGRGHNQLKTDPLQKRYNNRYRDWTNELEFSKTCGHTIHAETDAISSVTYPIAQQVNWKKAKAYVFRVTLGEDTGYMGLALPCPACAAALSDIGIKKAYYTTGRIDKHFGKCDL